LQDEEVPTNIVDEVLQRRKRAKKRDTDQEVTDEVMSLVSMVSRAGSSTAAWGWHWCGRRELWRLQAQLQLAAGHVVIDAAISLGQYTAGLACCWMLSSTATITTTPFELRVCNHGAVCCCTLCVLPTTTGSSTLQQMHTAVPCSAHAAVTQRLALRASTPYVQMTACAEKDASVMESRPPQPAIDKLKALGNVGSTLRQRKYHEMFIATKGLNAMAA
jgi:hypothetical protein